MYVSNHDFVVDRAYCVMLTLMGRDEGRPHMIRPGALFKGRRNNPQNVAR